MEFMNTGIFDGWRKNIILPSRFFFISSNKLTRKRGKKKNNTCLENICWHEIKICSVARKKVL